MDIYTEYLDYAFCWTAIDLDTFDGAPDASPECQLIGYGKTKAEAIVDLSEQIEDYEMQNTTEK